MNDNVIARIPAAYEKIKEATAELSFTMASDLYTGSFLKTLASSKPSGRFLELGTGTGLATIWITEGMDKNSSLITIENNELLTNIAKKHINNNSVEFLLTNAYEWIRNYKGENFDFIFADAIPGKYDLFDETICILKSSGFYIIDDMLPQPNWPAGHNERVNGLIKNIDERNDLVITKMNWSTGIMIVVKK